MHLNLNLTLCFATQVDPRVGVALEEMNNAMCRVNDLEASIVQAKRKVRVVEAEQKQKCQARRRVPPSGEGGILTAASCDRRRSTS